jgi:hypothetical protein
VVLCSCIIDDLRESRDVRGVETNQANPDGVFGDGRREDSETAKDDYEFCHLVIAR